MGIVNKPTTFVAGTTKSGEAAQVNADFDTLYNEFNGNIENANIKANAAIAQSKIADLANSLLYAAGLVAGTRMGFFQTTAPTGWTKETSAAYNDAALRIVTGTVTPTGGADAFSTHFGTGKSTAGFTLTIAETPSHSHNQNLSVTPTPVNNGEDFPEVPGRVDTTNVSTDQTGPNIGFTGGGGSHSHVLNNFNIKFADMIIAQKA